MTDVTEAPLPDRGSSVVAGPTVSFRFNLGRISDQGEDSDPILREGRDLALLAVFDGMGGAGGTVYETPDGPRTGAYLASRVARDVVERRMVELLEPDWYLDGRGAADDLRRSVRAALVERLEQLAAPRSGLRSKLLRALPTTMALVALQRSAADRWTGHVLWTGDSRAYVFDPEGARQLTTDDLRDPGDAMANLRRDSVVSNAMSADTDFSVSYRKVELCAPFMVVCATDGCFGYVPSPMHFEHLVLRNLQRSRDVASWSSALQSDISAVTGDDAAMALLGVGADLPQLKALFAPRVDVLEAHYVRPLDDAAHALREAEATVEARRQQLEATTAEVWQRYKPGYERHLNPVAEAETIADGAEPRDSRAADAGEEGGPPLRDARVPIPPDASAAAEADAVEEEPVAAVAIEEGAFHAIEQGADARRPDANGAPGEDEPTPAEGGGAS